MATKKKTQKKPKEPKPKTTHKGDVKIEHFRQNMRCELSDEEVNERAKRVSRALSEKALRVEAAKSATAHLKAEIKQFDAEISRLSQEINDGATYREVECERRFIYRTGKVVEIRADNGQQTYERAMTGAERQLDLPKAKAKKNGNADAVEEPSAEPAEPVSEAPGDDWDGDTEPTTADTEPPPSSGPVETEDAEPEHASAE